MNWIVQPDHLTSREKREVTKILNGLLQIAEYAALDIDLPSDVRIKAAKKLKEELAPERRKKSLGPRGWNLKSVEK